MHSLNQLIIVHLVEKAPDGSIFCRERAAWPLHITLVPWFHIKAVDESRLLTALRAYGATQHAFAVRVGREELFRARKDVPVNVIVDQTRIARLHSDLVALVKDYGTSEYAGANTQFRAHVTHHILDGIVHRRQKGSEEQIADFTVGRLLTGDCGQTVEIVTHVALGDAA